MLRMFVDVPRGVRPLARSGSLPILPASIVERLHGLVLELQGRLVPEVEPAG